MRVLIVDENPLVREPLRRFLAVHSPFAVVEEATSAEALDAVVRMHPDVVLIELGLQICDGLSLVRDLHGHSPKLPILILSLHSEQVFAERSLRSGASGYLMKKAPAATLTEALDCVCEGGIYLEDRARQCILHKIKGDYPTLQPEISSVLSDRELEVFHLLGEGYRTQDLARILGLSVKTVETHRSHIKRKLALSNNVSLTESASEWVLLHKLA